MEFIVLCVARQFVRRAEDGRVCQDVVVCVFTPPGAADKVRETGTAVVRTRIVLWYLSSVGDDIS